MPAVVEKRIGLNTYDISVHRGAIRVVYSSQLKHRLASHTGTLVYLSYTHHQLSAEDNAHEDNYLIDGILPNRRLR